MNIDEKIVELAGDLMVCGMLYHNLTEYEQSIINVQIKCAEDFITYARDVAERKVELTYNDRFRE